MNEQTKKDLDFAVAGLRFTERRINEALQGPFQAALGRVAEAADDGQMEDVESIRCDLLYLFEFLPHIQGGFYDVAWRLISKVHERVSDKITAQEAATILGQSEILVDIDRRLGRFQAFFEPDCTWLYARYEVEALKRQRDASKAYFNKLKATAK